jgi:transcriptional regulator with XRE-family HTH domain
MVSDRRGLGERLKRHRERRGITLDQISQSSKVPASLFAGLEAGDCSRWPVGLYARAYVRAYAEAIGLNADETVEEFTAAFGAAMRADGADGTPAAASQGGNALRLSLVEEPAIELEGLGRRTGLAAVDLLIGALLASIAHVGLGQGVWVTVACVLGYFTVGRIVSDEPLLYHVYRRLRTRSASPVVTEQAVDEVAPVGDAASTAA